MSNVRIACLLAGCLATFAPAAYGQTGSIGGKVTERTTGEAVLRATVSAIGSDGVRAGTGISRSDGSYAIADLPVGTYAVTVAGRVGLAARRIEAVNVRAGQVTNLDIVMAPIVMQLDQVVTTGTRGAELERIQESPNSISVVSAERIAERPSLTVTDHLKA